MLPTPTKLLTLLRLKRHSHYRIGTMNAKEIRQSFIEFFENKQHKFVRSSSVVPLDDPTLLFTNAGMNQFKPIFLGEKKTDYTRAVNSQKCIRVSGKHNDLEEVGVDTFHHTFFEMLGNWSFGDYYKAEAIQWGWELVTDVWKMDKNRLWATVYEEDDEAFDLWVKVTDIDPKRVLRCGKKDNFWEMGETGPCGPCSEIHYYIGEDLSKQSASGVNVTDEYWELWNLVFIQYHRDETGKLNDLPAKHVDTGAGLERIVTVMEGKTSNYDTDLFMPIIRKIEEISGKSYTDDPVPFRVIADHIRMLSFSIADGAMPGNEGRGYVLRRILRRAARFGRILDLQEPFIYELVDSVGEILGDVFPEVIDKRTHIQNVIKAEETSFNATLDRGLGHFDRIVKSLDSTVIPGEEAFRLYDTYGFPLDLTELIAREQGLSVDIAGFDSAMADQKSRAKAAGKFKHEVSRIEWKTNTEGADSQFTGYDTMSAESVIRRWAIQGNQLLVVLDKTPFYAESGGQVGDTGTMINNGIDLQVVDVKKDGDVFLHVCEGDFDESFAGQTVHCIVDADRRQAIRSNHTATHLMHKALKDELGDHVHQAGSLVSPDYLRFDVTHFEKITPKEIERIEQSVNREIIKNIPLGITIQSFDEARKSGAEALFGEKYGEEVRVVTIGDYSRELCGGTHVDRTGDIGVFKIVEEASLAAGVRRIVALTGLKAVQLMQENAALVKAMQEQLKCAQDEIIDRIDGLFKKQKDLEKAFKQWRSGGALNSKTIAGDAEDIHGKKVVIKEISLIAMDELKALGDELIPALGSGVAVIGMKGEKKPAVVVVVTPDLVKEGFNAGKIARDIGKEMGAGGGGKPHLATAGGRNNDDLDKALKVGREIIESALIKLQGDG